MDRFPCLELREIPTADPERAGLLAIEPTSFRPLLDTVGERGYGVDGSRRPHRVALELDRRPGGERMDGNRKAESEVSHLEGPPDHLLGIGGSVDVERFGRMVEAHALDEARETEEVVAVEVGHEDPSDPHERGGRLEELTLGALPTV